MDIITIVATILNATRSVMFDTAWPSWSRLMTPLSTSDGFNYENQSAKSLMSISKYLVTLSINLVHDSEHKLNCKSDESNLPAIVQVLTAEYGRLCEIKNDVAIPGPSSPEGESTERKLLITHLNAGRYHEAVVKYVRLVRYFLHEDSSEPITFQSYSLLDLECYKNSKTLWDDYSKFRESLEQNADKPKMCATLQRGDDEIADAKSMFSHWHFDGSTLLLDPLDWHLLGLAYERTAGIASEIARVPKAQFSSLHATEYCDSAEIFRRLTQSMLESARNKEDIIKCMRIL